MSEQHQIQIHLFRRQYAFPRTRWIQIILEALKYNFTSFSPLNSNAIWQTNDSNQCKASWWVFALTPISSACPLPPFYVLSLLPSTGCFVTATEPGGTELDILLSALQLQRWLGLREWAGECQHFKEQWGKKMQKMTLHAFMHVSVCLDSPSYVCLIYPCLNVFPPSN